jgi:apolipoprotein N-acyltransferase
MAALVRIFAALLSALLLAQAHSLEPISLTAWIAPVPLLIAVSGATGRMALICGAIAGSGSTALMLRYLFELGGLADLAIIVVLKAVVWAFIAFCHRSAMTHLPAVIGVFVFPLLMAGAETALAIVSPHGSAGALAYSQIEFLPVVQSASLGGAPAVTFIVCLFAAGAAMVLGGRGWLSAIMPTAIVAALLVWGVWRIPARTVAAAPGDLRIALVASDSYSLNAPDWRPAWAAYAAEAERAAQAGASFIVLPEKIVTLPASEAEAALERLYDLARRTGTVIAVGAVARDGQSHFNRAWMISAAGVEAYDKQHLVPGFERSFVSGTEDLVIDAGDARVGLAICKDLDFPALARRYGEKGAALMLAPAWDFTSDAWLHSRMAVLRGVEAGFYVLRSAREGLMTVSDPYGRVLAERPSDLTMATLAVSIPQPRRVATLYVRHGDILGWASLALGLILTFASGVAGRMRGPAHA